MHMFRPLCSPFSPDSLQMVSNLYWMFRFWTMISSTWWVSSGCQSTIRRTPTWHNLSCARALTSMMPPTPVFLLLFLMLSLKVHHVSSFHTDWAGNSNDLYRKQPNASSSIFEDCHEVCKLEAFLLCAASHFFPWQNRIYCDQQDFDQLLGD